MIAKIRDVQAFFFQLGGLHDARLLGIDWCPPERRLTIEVSDLCSNFAGFPEYKGKVPSHLTMESVTMVSLIVDPCDATCRIYDAEVHVTENGFKLVWQIAPCGNLIVTCESVVVNFNEPDVLPAEIKRLLV